LLEMSYCQSSFLASHKPNCYFKCKCVVVAHHTWKINCIYLAFLSSPWLCGEFIYISRNGMELWRIWTCSRATRGVPPSH